MSYVICPEKITSPGADPNEPPYLPPNAPCAVRCEVVNPAPVMVFKCGRGHTFYATPADVLDGPEKLAPTNRGEQQ